MTGSKSKGRKKYYFYYHCIHCKKARFKTDNVHNAFYRFLEKINLSVSNIKEINKIVKPICDNAIKDLKLEIDALKNKISRIQNKYIDDLIDKEAYDSSLLKAHKQIIVLREDMQRLSCVKKEYIIYLKRIIEVLSNLPFIYQHSSIRNKINLQKLILRNTIVFNEGKIIEAPTNELINFLLNPEKIFKQIQKVEVVDKKMTKYYFNNIQSFV